MARLPDLTTEEMWLTLTTLEVRYIAGPWVPIPPRPFREAHRTTDVAMYRWSAHGEPLAKARSQAEIVTEDQRLLALGYELTDQDRQIPPAWWVRPVEDDSGE
jgi:hypothetical protein